MAALGKVSKNWLVALGAAGALTLAFTLLALLLYLRTEARVVEKHSQDQQLLARSAAMAVTQRVYNYRYVVEQLAASLNRRPQREWPQALHEFPSFAPESNVLVLRSDGALTFARPARNPEALETAVLPWLGAGDSVLTNPFPAQGPDRQVVMLAPIVSGGLQVGQLGFVFPFDHLVESLFPQTAAGAAVSVSLLDEGGEVLANTRHAEMTGRRLPQSAGNCLPCHTSFALERRMAAGESGVGRIQVGHEPLALVAFVPVELPGRRWSLALGESYSAVTADTRQGFQAITFLLGLSLLVGVAATVVTLQYRLQRRRAEVRAELAERRATLERQLRHSEQLAALGKMTSQIAHQINTPLATVGLNVVYLREELSRRLGAASPELEEVGDAILAEIDRLKRVINDYLRFSRFPRPVLVQQSLREWLEALLDFVQPEARGHRVQLQVELGSDPAPVWLDADLFRDAFLNLVRNSFEAMPDGGLLRIVLRRENGQVTLSLEDTGRGIPPDIVPRIFDPFFTTKKDGTGLGLAHTRRVVEEQGGSIECASQPGRGTTFVVRFPLAGEESPASDELLLTEKEK